MRRIAKARIVLKETAEYRLCVNRTPRHIYAQVMLADGSQTLITASSLDPEIRALEKVNKTDLAARVGALVAKRALEKDIYRVAFDRSGHRYHGRIKALAEAVREQGLKL